MYGVIVNEIRREDLDPKLIAECTEAIATRMMHAYGRPNVSKDEFQEEWEAGLCAELHEKVLSYYKFVGEISDKVQIADWFDLYKSHYM